jgi:hypothetical protein
MPMSGIPITVCRGFVTSRDLSAARPSLVHIPKTGGTTIAAILHSMSLRRGLAFRRVTYSVSTWGDLSRCGAIAGHFFFDPEHPAFAPWQAITIVREPVERLISHLAMGIERGWLAPGDISTLLAGKPPTVTVGMASWFPLAWTGNLQTRYLAGVEGNREINRSDLDRAIGRIESGRLIAGPQDRLDDFVSYLIGCFGWPDLVYTRAQVGAYRRANLHPETAAMLAERERFDLALYRYVQESFARGTDGLARRDPWAAGPTLVGVPPIVDGHHSEKLVHIRPKDLATWFKDGWPLDSAGRPMFLDIGSGSAAPTSAATD